MLVREKVHRRKLNQRFGPELRGKKLVVLDIPDDYSLMDPVLVDILKVKVLRCVNLGSARPPELENSSQ